MAETEEAERAEDWAVDLVVTECARVDGGLDKAQLQEVVGVGTEDLRRAIETAELDGRLRIDGDRYVAVEEDDAGAIGQTAVGDDDEEVEVQEPPEVAAMEEADAAALAVSPPDGQERRTRIELDVLWRPGDAAEATDEGAVKVSDGLAALAANGISQQYPDLAVISVVESIEVIGTVRKIR